MAPKGNLSAGPGLANKGRKTINKKIMKEKEGNKTPRQPAKKPNKLTVDVKLKTQIKRRADTARETIANRSQDETDGTDSTPKKEVTFDPKVQVQGSEPESLAPAHEFQEGPAESPGRESEATQDGDGVKGDESTNQQTADNNDVDDEAADKNDEHKNDEEKEDKKSGKKGKKKGKGKKETKKEEKKKVAAKPAPDLVGEVTAGVEELRKFICEKVKDALDIVCTDGVTDMTVDNVTPLLHALDVDTKDEAIMDLIRDSLIDNFGIVNPLDLDTVIQKSQESHEETEMDDCLEVAFKLIDMDNDGFITQSDIYQLMLRLGEELAEYALDDMLAAVDMDGDGKISLRDFRHFLLGRDVPSRKEIFAMAAAAKQKREDDEARKRELEEQAAAEEAEQQNEDKTENSGDEENCQNADEEKKSEEVAPSVSENSSAETNTSSSDSGFQETSSISKTDSSAGVDEAKSKRKSLFAGCVQTVITTNTMVKEVEKSTEKDTVEIQQVSVQEKDPEPETEIVAEAEAEPEELDVDRNEHVASEIADDSKEEQNLIDSAHAPNDNVFIEAANDDSDEKSDTGEDGDGPVPLGLAPDILYLPPPDFADVAKSDSTPMASPMQSPRGPAIVGIGGLSVSPNEGDKSYAKAIHFLQEDMFKGDNEVPSRPHRKRSECGPIEETILCNSVQDVEDFNNRLVFKLPQRRKSSCCDPSGINDVSVVKNEEKIPCAAESDEGIDLTEEEFIEQTFTVPCVAAAPMSTLRISLPNNEDLNADDLFPNTARTSRSGSRISYRRRSSDDRSVKEGEMSTLGIGLMPDTPRSMSRSEMSHISLVSPRTDCQISDDDDDYGHGDDDDAVDEENDEDDDMYHPPSKTAMDTSNKSECDADSVWLALGESEIGSSIQSHRRKYVLEDLDMNESTGVSDDSHRGSSEDLSSKRTPRKKNNKILKRSLSCQRIELKELTLNNPVTVGQFSNRHKFGMIPRQVSKFLVLGKSQPIEGPKKPESTTRIRIREQPEIISPSFRVRAPDRPQTAIMTSRERDVLQERRISLMHDQNSPLLDYRRNFDSPTLSSSDDKIEVPTGNEPSTTTLLDRVKTMEGKILKRSKTSFELPALSEINDADGNISHRSDKSRPLEKVRAISASFHRKSGSLTFDKFNDFSRLQDRKVSVVDLSKSLRKEDACKSTASLAKRHSGFTSIVPLARVVMAYQNVKRKRSQSGFHSISRQLERSGMPFQTQQTKSRPTSPRKKSSYAPMSSARGEKKNKSKFQRRRSISADNLDDLVDPFLQRPEEDISTLVGDFSDPDALPNDVVFEKVRPFTAHPSIGSTFSRHVQPMSGRGMTTLPQSKVMTLEIPDANKFEKKVKNVSLLSKLPIK